MDGWMVVECLVGWLDEWVFGWMDGWLDESVFGWMGGWMDRYCIQYGCTVTKHVFLQNCWRTIWVGSYHGNHYCVSVLGSNH